jgi:hypothetical protein
MSNIIAITPTPLVTTWTQESSTGYEPKYFFDDASVFFDDADVAFDDEAVFDPYTLWTEET